MLIRRDRVAICNTLPDVMCATNPAMLPVMRFLTLNSTVAVALINPSKLQISTVGLIMPTVKIRQSSLSGTTMLASADGRQAVVTDSFQHTRHMRLRRVGVSGLAGLGLIESV